VSEPRFAALKPWLTELTPRPRWDLRVLGAGFAALLASLAGLVLLEAAGLDLAISDLFYDRTTHRWLVDFYQDRGLQRLFYRWPKIAVGVLTAILLVLLVAPAAWRARVGRGAALPRSAIACVLCFWLFSATVSVLKDRTDIYYPRQLARYQVEATLPAVGQWQQPGVATTRIPYRRLWERYAPPRPAGIKPGRGFPAAHATAGFWLMGLAALATSRRARLIWLLVGSGAGWLLGLYQTVNGNHFVSHTLVSWGIAAAFLSVLWCLWGLKANRAS
jgi:membrane-associated PAP2 superfamily phosphatase